ncbi:MAG: FGGY-family carbohydrate kinase, partial [Spirochaetaceae bacterium]
MSLLGIDVGTTGSKAVVFALDGTILGTAYTEYDISRPQAGYAELDARGIWPRIKDVVARAVAAAGRADPVQALAVSSMGENLVPVSKDRRILGPSIMNLDERGEEFVPSLAVDFDPSELYRLTGNALTNQFSITKVMWTKKYRPELYENTDYFLVWNSFVAFMLGGEPRTDYSLANRTLLFDVDREDWSAELLKASGLEREKLPSVAPAGTPIGTVADAVAEELGLPREVPVVVGTHDQCAASLGSGAIRKGTAMWGLGTFQCIAPVYAGRKPAEAMLERGLNTEHHAVPDRFITLIYNMGGSVVKWYRNTFAGREHEEALAAGEDVYPRLFGELPSEPSSVRVLPHFAPMGPPDFIERPDGAFVGMTLGTSRGEILKGILEGNIFSLKISVDALDAVSIAVDEFRTTGGGAKSNAGLQLCADIMGRPCVRPEVTEAGALGSAILAGVGAGVFSGVDEAISRTIRLGPRYEPNLKMHERYIEPFEEYKQLRRFV